MSLKKLKEVLQYARLPPEEYETHELGFHVTTIDKLVKLADEVEAVDHYDCSPQRPCRLCGALKELGIDYWAAYFAELEKSE